MGDLRDRKVVTDYCCFCHAFSEDPRDRPTVAYLRNTPERPHTIYDAILALTPPCDSYIITCPWKDVRGGGCWYATESTVTIFVHKNHQEVKLVITRPVYVHIYTLLSNFRVVESQRHHDANENLMVKFL